MIINPQEHIVKYIIMFINKNHTRLLKEYETSNKDYNFPSYCVKMYFEYDSFSKMNETLTDEGKVQLINSSIDELNNLFETK
jgi:hypothetical protein